MLPLQHFYMIRHGQTEANAKEVMAGSIDSPLTKLGIKQAQAARDLIDKLTVKPEIIFHSHLSRARDTAKIINESLDVDLIEDSDLAEIHAGDMEGVSYEITRTLFTTWKEVPNGEKPQDFFERVKRGKSKALTHRKKPPLIVCHGGVMRAFGEINSVPTPGIFENAHLYEFVPNTTNENLPWDVYDYVECPKSRKLFKNRSNVYSANN